MNNLNRLYNIVWFFIFVSTTILNAQQNANNWYFGNRASIGFSTDPPTERLTSVLNTFEGSSVLNDSSGNVLAYTDGATIYNKNNSVMPNGIGLLGENSSSQSALIVK